MKTNNFEESILGIAKPVQSKCREAHQLKVNSKQYNSAYSARSALAYQKSNSHN